MKANPLGQISLRPKLVESLQHYSWARFRADVVAGITVGIVALPLAMAFAIASGVPPQTGLVTAIVAGFLISALGGTQVCIGGPTGAFIVIIYGIVSTYGLANLLICTLMAGVFLIIMGFMRLGNLIKFFPNPLIIGFTNGIAILILLTQLRDFFGLSIHKMPSGFIPSVQALWQAAPTVHLATLVMASLALLCLRRWPEHWGRYLPAPMMVLISCSLITPFINSQLTQPLTTIGSQFGAIPQGFPAFQWPSLSWEHLSQLVAPAFTIALLGAIESLLCAVVADGMTNDKHDANQELIAQGIANLVTPFFGGIPATGAIARTATNIKNGGKTPIAGIVHALVLLLVLLFAAPLATHIPLAALAAILVNVALNMGEWHEFKELPHYPKSDSAVLVTTFLLTVIFDLTVAVELGLLLAGVLFIRRMAEQTVVDALDAGNETELESQLLRQHPLPKGVMIFRVQGALFFGAADKLDAVLHNLGREPNVLILRLSRLISLDATALHALTELQEKIHRHHKHLILCGTPQQPYQVLNNAGLIAKIGTENVVTTLEAALTRAEILLNQGNQ